MKVVGSMDTSRQVSSLSMSMPLSALGVSRKPDDMAGPEGFKPSNIVASGYSITFRAWQLYYCGPKLGLSGLALGDSDRLQV